MIIVLVMVRPVKVMMVTSYWLETEFTCFMDGMWEVSLQLGNKYRELTCSLMRVSG